MTPILRPAACFFDFDGTLMDTAPDIIGVLNEVLGDSGLPPLPLDRGLIGPPLEEIIAMALPGLSQTEQDAIRLEYRARYREHHYGNSRVFTGIIPLLHRLQAAGIPAFVATNKPEAVSRRFLDIKGIAGLFRDVVSRDSLPGKALSKAEMLLMLTDRHGLETPNCLMVGDSVLDMRGGRKAGMKTAAALYGYTRREAMLAEEPDIIVEDEGWSEVRLWPSGEQTEVCP